MSYSREGRTLYILEGSERTDCTFDPKAVAGMREKCGPSGKIYVWRCNFNNESGVEWAQLDGAEWPQYTPDFPGWPSTKIKLS